MVVCVGVGEEGANQYSIIQYLVFHPLFAITAFNLLGILSTNFYIHLLSLVLLLSLSHSSKAIYSSSSKF